MTGRANDRALSERLENGKAAENGMQMDRVGLMQQSDVIPTPRMA